MKIPKFEFRDFGFLDSVWALFQRDPANQFINPYLYCGNNLVMMMDPDGEFGILAGIGIGIGLGWLFYGISTAVTGVDWSWSQFALSGLIGGLSGGAASWAGGAVAAAIAPNLSIGSGFVGGAISGMAAGAAGGFVGGSLSAWTGGAGFGQGLLSGLKGAGFGALAGGIGGGLGGGIRAVRNGYSFWNGSTVNEILLDSGHFPPVEFDQYNDAHLHARFKKHFGKGLGDLGIEKLTMQTDGNYYIRSDGFYGKKGLLNPIGGYVKGYLSGASDIHISPYAVFTPDDIVFRAIAGHEYIHAYHYYIYGPQGVDRTTISMNSERVAYDYTYNTYLSSGRHHGLVYDVGDQIERFFGTWPNVPSHFYNIPISPLGGVLYY